MNASITVRMGGAPMYGPPYSTVSTAVSHYPNEVLSTLLHVHTYTRRYNWADITQEIYGVAQCDEFATGPFLVTNISMSTGSAAVDMRTVDWNLTSAKPCFGQTKVLDDTTISIEHNKP